MWLRAKLTVPFFFNLCKITWDSTVFYPCFSLKEGIR